ncbi:hypothetical protein QP028_04135 [Corynebacterium suedekumii]|nr:hypothetical protein QP028_04135 [Corynebacterium suedekumii]
MREPSERTFVGPMRSWSSPMPVRRPRSRVNSRWPSTSVSPSSWRVVRYGMTVARTPRRPESRAIW